MQTVTRDRYDAFLLDLDGTILDGRGELAPATREAVARLVDAGYVVVLATGRSPSGTRQIHQALGLDNEACCYNGSWIGRLDGQAPPFHYSPIPDEFVPHLAPLESRARHRFRHHGDRKYTVKSEEATQRRLTGWFTHVSEVDADHALPSRDLVRVSVFYDGAGSADAAWEALGEPARSALERQTFPMAIFPGWEEDALHLCEVQRKGRGKAEAFRLLSERHGIDASRVVVVGDQANDLCLFEDAGLAVSMGNGIPAVRAAADVVIGDHREDGFARFVAADVR
jgi:Cof subfamily protein (haloacid dehalogenase superfamily)